MIVLLVVVVAAVTALELDLTPDELVNARRQTRNRYFFYDSSATTMMVDRELMTYRDDHFDAWSKWSECSPHACLEHRFRRCADDSYMQPLNQMTASNTCPFKFLAEERPCKDQSKCIKGSKPSELLERMNSICGKMTFSSDEEERNEESTDGHRTQLKLLNSRLSSDRNWPWNVAIYKAANYNASEGLTKLMPDHVICGGTLIAPKWVITGAHCLKPVLSDRPVKPGQPFSMSRDVMGTISLLIRAGDTYLDGSTKASGGETDHVVEEIIIHPDWSSERINGQYDVALLKLADDVNIESGSAGVACLPTAEAPLPPEEAVCYAVGWGENTPSPRPVRGRGGYHPFFSPFFFQRGWSFGERRRNYWNPNGERPTKLREMVVNILPSQKCFHHDDVNEVQICAGQQNKGVCAGDTGAGLFCRAGEEGSRWSVYGVMGSEPTQRCRRNSWLYNTIGSVLSWIYFHVK